MDYTSINDLKYAFIGGGKIAGIFIERIISARVTKCANIIASDINEERRHTLRKKYGIHVTDDNCESSDFGDVVFVALPPGGVKAILSESCKAIDPQKMIISLAAAVPTWIYESVLCKTNPIIRMIPNLPSLIGNGVNPYSFGQYVTDKHVPFIDELLALFGTSIRIDERMMNTATALTAVGPTYILPVIKALEDAAVSNGLQKDIARTLTTRMIEGTAAISRETMRPPSELQQLIGVHYLDEHEIHRIFSSAFTRAYEKIEKAEEKITA
jgi:pyrroline-5-carboxylate reductase